MYRTEEIKGKVISTEEYLEHYVDVAEFLEYCKKCENYNRSWACPPYDFNPEDFWKKYGYLYVMGTKIIFDQETRTKEAEKEELQEYMREVLATEKRVLSKRMQALEEKYSGSISLSAGGACQVCGSCSRLNGKPCSCPDDVRYSIESLGGNVGLTVSKLLKIELQWMDEKLPEYFTLVNGLLTDDPNIEL